MSFLKISRGNSPVVLTIPHSGTELPEDVRSSLNERGLVLADTDWHIDRLYDGLLPDATIIRTHIHRYVIDVNRDPSGQSLYPRQNTTTLIPLTDFDGHEIWDKLPTEAEIERRRRVYHTPYHDEVCFELKRVHALHGHAILYDCHSIRSRIPFLFNGYLPDFNIGTNQSVTADSKIEECVVEICSRAKDYSSTLNGRFKGGWTVRHYGKPQQGVHAIQMELAQNTYLEVEKPPWTYCPTKSDHLRIYLKNILAELNDWRPS